MRTKAAADIMAMHDAHHNILTGMVQRSSGKSQAARAEDAFEILQRAEIKSKRELLLKHGAPKECIEEILRAQRSAHIGIKDIVHGKESLSHVEAGDLTAAHTAHHKLLDEILLKHRLKSPVRREFASIHDVHHATLEDILRAKDALKNPFGGKNATSAEQAASLHAIHENLMKQILSGHELLPAFVDDLNAMQSAHAHVVQKVVDESSTGSKNSDSLSLHFHKMARMISQKQGKQSSMHYAGFQGHVNLEDASPAALRSVISQRVDLPRRCGPNCGLIRFCGKVNFSSGIFIGIELDRPIGRNDGSIDGTRYFRAPAKHGVFVRPRDALLAGSNVPVHEHITARVHEMKLRAKANNAASTRRSVSAPGSDRRRKCHHHLPALGHLKPGFWMG